MTGVTGLAFVDGVQASALGYMPAGEAADACAVAASAGKDAVVRLWTVESNGKAAAARLTERARLIGAEDACTGVAVAPSGTLVAASDWTGAVHLWDTTANAASAAGGDSDGEGAGASASKTSKRRRVEDAAGVRAASSGVSTFAAPLCTLQPRIAAATTGVVWVGSGAVASSNMDGSLRLWDIEGGLALASGAGSDSAHGSAGDRDLITSASLTLHCTKAALSITASPFGSLLASGHTDGCVRVWDTRTSSATGAVGKIDGLRGLLKCSGDANADPAWASAVAWSAESSHLLLSATHSGAVDMWDVRAIAAPLCRVHTHAKGQKAMAVCWAGEAEGAESAERALLISGGQEGRIRASVMPA
jgi:ribosome biogenesis protein YTM1